MSQPPQPPTFYGQPVAPRKRKIWPIAFAGIAFVFLICVVGALAINNSGAGKTSGASTQAAGGTQDTRTTEATTAAATTKAATRTVSAEEQNAIRSAQEYLASGAFSRKGLIRQLSSDAGDGYSVKAATAAVDSLHIDFNEQAAKSAKMYLQTGSFSRKGLIEQLESDAGEGFTHAQAVYGVTRAGL